MRWSTLFASVLFAVVSYGAIQAGEPAVEPSPAAMTALTQRKLSTFAEASYKQRPTDEILKDLLDRLQIDFHIDRDALADAAVAGDKPLSLEFRRIRADLLLDVIMKEGWGPGFDYIVRDGIVFFAADENPLLLEVKVYSLADLLHKAEVPPVRAGQPGQISGGAQAIEVPLITAAEDFGDIVQSTIDPDSWYDNNGRPGQMNVFGETLVVRQHQRVHRQIEELLFQLRQAMEQGASLGKPAKGDSKEGF